MYNWIVASFTAAFLIGCSPAVADSYGCSTVDDSATLNIVSGSSISVSEKDKQCTFSVNGATGSHARSALFFESLELFMRDAIGSGVSGDLDRATFIKLMVSPFLPEFDVDSFVFEHEDELNWSHLDPLGACIGSFAEQALGSTFTFQPEIPTLEDDRVRCLAMEETDPFTGEQRRTLVLRYEVPVPGSLWADDRWSFALYLPSDLFVYYQQELGF